MMEILNESGIQLILALQALGDWPALLAGNISLLGIDSFYLLVAPVLFWSVDTVMGLRFGLYVMTSTSINYTLKLLFHSPRPYWYSRQIHAYTPEPSFGMPSTHAQNAVVGWGSLAYSIKRTWAWLVCIVLIILIGLSRIYLGVHFPFDVLIGWIVGALLLWLLIKAEGPALTWLRSHHLYERIVACLAVSILFILLAYLVDYINSSWVIPPDWIANAEAVFPDDPIDPLSLQTIYTASGAFFGLSAGAVLLFAQGGYNAGGQVWKRVVRYILGLMGVLLLYLLLGSIFPRGEDPVALIARYVRYGLIGYWVSYLAPQLFIRLKLAERR